MARFIDKMNLPQFKFFQEIPGQIELRNDIASQYITAEHLLRYGNKKDRAQSMMVLHKMTTLFPGLVFTQESDIAEAHMRLAQGDLKRKMKLMDRYTDVLLILHVFQGSSYVKTYIADESELNGQSQEETEQRFEWDQQKKVYCRKVTTVPKLVLIEDALFRAYLGAVWTSDDAKRLFAMLPRDVHYIVNVQSPEQAEVTYIVEISAKGHAVISSLDRINLLKRDIPVEGITDDCCVAVLFSLLDYLSEIRHIRPRKADRQSTDSVVADDRIGRYIAEGSIKVFDMTYSALHDLTVHDYRRKRGSLTVARRAGYEVMPHTRRGHYRTYKSGKTVYIRSTIIHKDKYTGIQSAHRINASDGSMDGGD